VLVQEAYNASHQVYGYRRIVLWIQQKPALKINHKAVLRLMNKLNIRSRARKRKMYRKLEEIGTYHRDPNILNRILLPPDQTRNGSPILPMS
jgi:putative transposase